MVERRRTGAARWSDRATITGAVDFMGPLTGRRCAHPWHACAPAPATLPCTSASPAAHPSAAPPRPTPAASWAREPRAPHPTARRPLPTSAAARSTGQQKVIQQPLRGSICCSQQPLRESSCCTVQLQLRELAGQVSCACCLSEHSISTFQSLPSGHAAFHTSHHEHNALANAIPQRPLTLSTSP